MSTLGIVCWLLELSGLSVTFNIAQLSAVLGSKLGDPGGTFSCTCQSTDGSMGTVSMGIVSMGSHHMQRHGLKWSSALGAQAISFSPLK